MLEIVFEEPLERFRTIRVILGEGIMGTDGLPLKPYTLTFTLGGRLSRYNHSPRTVVAS